MSRAVTYNLVRFVETTKLVLSRYLPDRLTALNLPQIHYWRTGELTSAPGYPICLILCVESGIDASTLNIIFLATNPDSEELRRQLYGYIQAAVEVLFERQTELPGFPVPDSVLADFSRAYYSRPGGYLADARLSIKIKWAEEVLR